MVRPLLLCMVCLIASSAVAQERIAEIRVHGNHTTPDVEVISLSGLHVGDDATDARLMDASRALRASGRFEDIDVRKRFLSIVDPSQILVMLVVEEHAGVSADHPVPGPLRRMRAASMWLPVLGYADGYGFTYGARLAFVNPLGPSTRVSVPLTWGGERRAGIDAERIIGNTPGAPALRLTGGIAAYRRVNPFFDAPDSRLDAHGRAEHAFTSWLRIGGTASTAQVSFSPRPFSSAASLEPETALIEERDRHDAIGADVTIDTRLDPSFPRNAVYARIGVDRVSFASDDLAGPVAFSEAAVVHDAAPLGTDDRTHARRQTLDARGYVGIGRPVLGVRALFLTSDTALPHSEQPLLGGADTLRGYRAGYAADDNLAAISTEIRVPLNSPLSFGRLGVEGFVDWGATWSADARLRDQKWNRGIGGGVFFGAGPVIADVAIAWPEHGGPRAHVALGVSF